MGDKGGMGVWSIVIVSTIVLVLLLLIYLIFSGNAGSTIRGALEFIRNLFKFG